MISVDMSEVLSFSKLLEIEANEVAGRVERALEAQQHVILTRARAAAPEATGALKRDIRPIGRRGMSRRVRAGKKKTFYSRFQEFGTRKMAANPFLLKQANPGSQAEFERRVQTAISHGRIYR